VVKLTGKAAVAAMALGLMGVTGMGSVAYAEEKAKRVLTPEELAEKESRKACKIEICKIFRSKQTSAEKVACDIQKSWREEDIKEMVAGGKIGWRWGKMVCRFKLDLEQAALADAVSKPEHDLKIKPHNITCTVDKKSGGETYDISVGISPEVKFKDGKAIEGRMNWGTVTAPMLVKGIVWPGIKLDNQANIIGGKLVKMVNGFMTKKCDQVKDEL
jgi:hypothetical protein